MPRPLSPSRPKRPLFRFFVVLGILLIVTLLLALRAFNFEISSLTSPPEDVPKLPESSTSEDIKALEAASKQIAEAHPSDTMPSISGFVSEVVHREKTGGKWIKVSVVSLDEKLVASGDKEMAEPKEEKTALSSDLSVSQYTFFLSDKETEGGKDIKGGEEVTIFFTGALSTTDYILAKKVEEMGREGEMK